MSFDEEHLDEHYLCQREVAERDARIRELEAALRRLFAEIDSRFGSIADMSPELLEVMLQAKDALAGSPSRNDGLSTGPALSDATQDRGGEHE